MPNYVQVPVPEERVEEIMRLLVGVGSQDSTASRTAGTPKAGVIAAGLNERFPEYAEMRDDDVRHAYRASEVGGRRRELFEYLAEHPDEEFSYEVLSRTFGWGRHSLPGVISAYNKGASSRYGGQRPFRIYQDGAHEWFMSMDARVARIIREEASR